MTYEQAHAFLRTAKSFAADGRMPAESVLYMSIGIAAQFAFGLRQKDIISEYPPSQADADREAKLAKMGRCA